VAYFPVWDKFHFSHTNLYSRWVTCFLWQLPFLSDWFFSSLQTWWFMALEHFDGKNIYTLRGIFLMICIPHQLQYPFPVGTSLRVFQKNCFSHWFPPIWCLSQSFFRPYQYYILFLTGNRMCHLSFYTQLERLISDIPAYRNQASSDKADKDLCSQPLFSSSLISRKLQGTEEIGCFGGISDFVRQGMSCLLVCTILSIGLSELNAD